MAKKKTSKKKPVALTMEEMRDKLAILEIAIAGVDAGTIENCSQHIAFWRMREAIINRGITEMVGDDEDATRLSFLMLRQASELCAQWEQRREQAKRSAGLDRLDELEQLIRDRHEGATRLSRIRTNA